MSDEKQDLLEKVKKKADDTYALLASLSASHEMLKDKVQDISYDICTKISLGQHQEANSKIVSSFEEIKKEFFSLRDHKDSIYAKIRKLEADINELKNALREILCDQYDMRKLINDIDKKIRPEIDQVYNHINENVDKAKKQLYTKIDELVIPKDTVNMAQVKEQITHQTEPAWLDARNALLIARTHELRLSILEKKMEGVLLQLKHSELTK